VDLSRCCKAVYMYSQVLVLPRVRLRSLPNVVLSDKMHVVSLTTCVADTCTCIACTACMHAGLGQPNFPSDDERTLGRYPSRDNPGLDIHSSPLDEEDLASINRRGTALESMAQVSPHAQQGHQQHPTSPLVHSSSMGRGAGSTAALQLRPPSARMQPSAQPLVPPSGGSMGVGRRNDSSSNTGVGQDLGDGALVAAVAAEGQDGVESSSDGRSLLNPRGSASFQGMSRGESLLWSLLVGGGGIGMCTATAPQATSQP
jgi:hypothetical protein